MGFQFPVSPFACKEVSCCFHVAVGGVTKMSFFTQGTLSSLLVIIILHLNGNWNWYCILDEQKSFIHFHAPFIHCLFIGAFSTAEEFCDKDGCEATKKEGESPRTEYKNCKMFKRSDFGPESKSIFFGEARGRLGNQLLGYALMQHYRFVSLFFFTECLETRS